MTAIKMSLKSIQKAIDKISNINIDYKEVRDLFMVKCYYRLIELANMNLDAISDFEESEIKTDIKTMWTYEIIGNMMTVRNNSDKAVYIEFGVGIVGEQDPHPGAGDTGYEYNITTEAKDSDGYWNFAVYGDRPIDLRRSNYTIHSRERGQRLLIKTKGNEPGLYVFNALMNFISNNEAKKLWKESLNEHYGVK